MFLDDIGKAVGDAVGEETNLVPKIDLGSMGKDIFNDVTSAEMRLFSGVAKSADTVASVFGGLDLFDSAATGGMAGLGEKALGASLRELGQELTKVAQLLDPESQSACGAANAPDTGYSQQPADGVYGAISRIVGQQQGNDNIYSQGIGRALAGQENLAQSAARSPFGNSFSSISDELNPQPLPPGPPDNLARVLSEGLNPQPLPPGPNENFARFVSAELNPQPLPPGPPDSFASRVQINPQPLPPGPEAQFAKLKSLSSRMRI